MWETDAFSRVSSRLVIPSQRKNPPLPSSPKTARSLPPRGLWAPPPQKYTQEVENRQNTICIYYSLTANVLDWKMWEMFFGHWRISPKVSCVFALSSCHTKVYPETHILLLFRRTYNSPYGFSGRGIKIPQWRRKGGRMILVGEEEEEEEEESLGLLFASFALDRGRKK